MNVGDRVVIGIGLPGIPIGTVGRVKEVGRLFIVVQFEDGRQAYYARHQLTAVSDDDPGSGSGGGRGVPLGVTDRSVPYGTHLCLLPAARAEAIDATARFLATGLAAGDTCLCVLPGRWHDPLGQSLRRLGADAYRAMRAGKLRLERTTDVYYRPSRFSAKKQLLRVAEALSRLSSAGPSGIRCCGYASEPLYSAEGWWEYERRVTPIMRAKQALCMCGYDPAGQGTAAWRRAADVHEYVIRGMELLPGGLGGR
jgi:hypothetical protein